MLSMFITMCKGGIIVPLLIYMCWRSMLPLSMSMCMCWSFFWGGAMLRLSMSMCMYWEVNVVSEHVDVYVIRGVNFSSVHFHVYVYVLGKGCQCCLFSSPCVREGGSMLPLFLSM